MAAGLKDGILASLQNSPLGLGPNEANLQTPFNTPREGRIVTVRVRNHSAQFKRRVLKIAVSYKRGGDEAVLTDKYRKSGMSMETIQRLSLDRDMNVYTDVVVPVTAVIRFNSKIYRIPPADDPASIPPEVVVPEGVYDLYLGNYDRMHSADHRDRNDEAQRLFYRWGSGGSRAVLYLKDDGTPDQDRNPFGFLEFIREVSQPLAQAIDAEQLAAGQIVEV
jgi:hypothetical protein